jgi:hypothetical protein
MNKNNIENELTAEQQFAISNLGYCRGLTTRLADVEVMLPYITIQGNEDTHKFIFDSYKHALRAREMGMHHMMWDNTKRRPVMNYDFSPEHALVYPVDSNSKGVQKLCHSFLPCLGLTPNSRRKDVDGLFDCRTRSFKNHSSPLRHAKFEDYKQSASVCNDNDYTGDVYGDEGQMTKMCLDVFDYVLDPKPEPQTTPVVEPVTDADAESLMFAATIKAIQDIKKCSVLEAIKYYQAVDALQ